MKQKIIRLFRDETGQTLPLALIVLVIGSILVGSFLMSISSDLLNSQVYNRRLNPQYAADAGVEDAIWRLVYGDLLTQITEGEGQASYSLPEEVNGFIPAITVSWQKGIVASHNFNDNDWAGGTGWLSPWVRSGDTQMTASGAPYEGSRHLQLRRNTGYAERSVDLSGYGELRLEFWAKVYSFEGNDEMHLIVSPDGSNWTTAMIWDATYSDNTYYFYSIDLSLFTMSSNFRIAFRAHMNAANDYFYVDDLSIVSSASIYEIVSNAGGQSVRATVSLTNGQVTILSWVLDTTT